MSEAVRTALNALSSPWRVPADESTTSLLNQYEPEEEQPSARQRLKEVRAELQDLQRLLYAGKQFSVLCVFQALDAAGKDGAIREVFETTDASGVDVSAFKRPTRRELAHDFLWRTTRQLPARGMIGVFNRSYYEEVLTVRVHPEYLNAQYAGAPPAETDLWPARYRAIREHERHLEMAHTLILKFWLNVSPQRQARRFLERLDDPEKRWKYSQGDIVESGFRTQYDEAVERMFAETSREHAPWFCIPADDRWYCRWQIAEVLCQALKALPLKFPQAADIPPGEAAETRDLLNSRLNPDG